MLRGERGGWKVEGGQGEAKVSKHKPTSKMCSVSRAEGQSVKVHFYLIFLSSIFLRERGENTVFSFFPSFSLSLFFFTVLEKQFFFFLDG